MRSQSVGKPSHNECTERSDAALSPASSPAHLCHRGPYFTSTVHPHTAGGAAGCGGVTHGGGVAGRAHACSSQDKGIRSHGEFQNSCAAVVTQTHQHPSRSAAALARPVFTGRVVGTDAGASRRTLELMWNGGSHGAAQQELMHVLVSDPFIPFFKFE